jgi:hypothetical protein
VIYAIVYLLLSVLVPLGSARGRKNIALLVLVTMLLFLFVGFRWQVGCDWGGYENIFEITRQSTVEEAISNREPGFTLLNIFIHNLKLDYFWVNVVGAFLFFLGLFLFARRQENPLAIMALSFPVLIMNMPMSGVRQGIAIGFFMIAINAYRDGRRVLFAALVLLGGTFHQSAFLFLGLTPLIRLRKTVLTVAGAALLTLPALYFLATGAIGFYAERYGGDAADAAGAPFRTALLAIVGLMFLVFFRRRWREKYPDDYEVFLIASVLMIVTLPLALYFSIIGDRLGYYLIPFQIVVLARIPQLVARDKLRPLYAVAPYIGFFIFFVAWISLSPLFEGCYVPYWSVLLEDV